MSQTSKKEVLELLKKKHREAIADWRNGHSTPYLAIAIEKAIKEIDKVQ